MGPIELQRPIYDEWRLSESPMMLIDPFDQVKLELHQVKKGQIWSFFYYYYKDGYINYKRFS